MINKNQRRILRSVIDEWGDVSWNRFRKKYKEFDPDNKGNRLEEDFRALHR